MAPWRKYFSVMIEAQRPRTAHSSAKTASLTEKGKQVFLESRFYSRSMEQKITENLSQDEIQELKKIFKAGEEDAT